MRLIILLFITMSCGMSDAQTVVEKIDSKKLVELMETPDIQLLDVRTLREVKEGYIEEAVHIDFFDQNFEKLANQLNKNKPLIVYCAAGGRSAKSGDKLAAMGFTKIYDLTGGINQWKQDGYPLVK